jgi:hypothetical protein
VDPGCDNREHKFCRLDCPLYIVLSIESSAINRVIRGRRSAWFRTPDCQSGGRGFKSRRPRHFLCSRIQTAGIERATEGFEGGMHPSRGAYEGAGLFRRSWRGRIQGRAGDGARFKSRRPRPVLRLALTPREGSARFWGRRPKEASAHNHRSKKGGAEGAQSSPPFSPAFARLHYSGAQCSQSRKG